MQAAASSRSKQPRLFHLPNPLGERMGADFFRSLPAVPGVYRFYGSDDRLLYVGQSNDLRARVGSYRHVVPERHPRRTLRLVGRITRIEWEVCATAEAAIARERLLLLELRPPFNRAGVWQGEPWWFQAQEVEGHLTAHISRETCTDGIGPLPSPFRYAFAALMRCTYRWLHPELTMAEYPLGLFNHTIPLAVRWPVTQGSAVSTGLTQWATGESDAFVQLLSSIEPKRPVPAGEAEYWLEQMEVLTKFWNKWITRPQVPAETQ